MIALEGPRCSGIWQTEDSGGNVAETTTSDQYSDDRQFRCLLALVVSDRILARGMRAPRLEFWQRRWICLVRRSRTRGRLGFDMV